MYETVIVIFLLFFAVLAFGYFYLQRAKARVASSDAVVATEPAGPTPDTTVAEASVAEAAPAEPTATDPTTPPA